MKPSSPFVRALAWWAAGACLAIAAGSASAAGSAAADPDLAAVAQFSLNDKVIGEYTVVFNNFVTLQKEHPDIAKQLNEEGDQQDSDQQTIADEIAWINKYPVISNAITQSGMSVHDYILCTLAVIQAGIYAYMVQSQGDAGWKNVPAGVPTDNVRYYLANKAKFDAINKLGDQLNGGDKEQND